MDPLQQDTQVKPDILSSHNSSQEEHRSFGSHLVEFIQTLVIFLAIASAIYWQIAQPHKVSGSSMVPNFHNGDYIITDKLTYKFSEPKRGDVIVFKNPRNMSEDFIKRIIGLPGDKVKVENGQVFLNDKLLNQPFLASNVVTSPNAFLQEGVDTLVPEDHFIVFGDNRPNSSDSREWGFIRKDEIIGRVILRYWPKEAIGIFPAAYSINQ